MRDPLRSSDGQDGDRSSPRDELRNAAEERPRETATAMRSHDDEIRADLLRRRFDLRARIARTKERDHANARLPMVRHHAVERDLRSVLDALDDVAGDDPGRV